MCITTNTMKSCVDIPEGMMEEERRLAMLDDEHIGMPSEPVLCGLPWTKAEVSEVF